MVSKNGVEPLGTATLYSKCGMATIGKEQFDDGFPNNCSMQTE
jgi:hypothetical protein